MQLAVESGSITAASHETGKTMPYSASRRGLFGLLAAAPLMAVAAVPSSTPSHAGWTAALAAYRRASAALAALPHDHAEAEIDLVTDRVWTATDSLLATPAPTMAAFAEKLTILRDERADDVMDAGLLDLLRRDALRLAARA